MHTYKYAYMHTYMHTYIHTCIHTYMNTYTYTQDLSHVHAMLKGFHTHLGYQHVASIHTIQILSVTPEAPRCSAACITSASASPLRQDGAMASACASCAHVWTHPWSLWLACFCWPSPADSFWMLEWLVVLVLVLVLVRVLVLVFCLSLDVLRRSVSSCCASRPSQSSSRILLHFCMRTCVCM